MIKDTPMPQKLKTKPPKDHGIPVTSLCVCVCVCVWLVAQSCLTLCNARLAHQAPLSMGFSRGAFLPRDRTQVSCITAVSLLSEPPGEHKYLHMSYYILY